MAQHKIRHSRPKRIIRWLLSCAILAVLSWIFFILAGRALCYVAIRQIGDLTHTKIRTESVDFRTNGSVFIKHLVIRPDQEQEEDNAIIDAGMVFARFSLGSLLMLRPRLKAIDVNDFVVNAQYNQDTHQWNLSALKLRPPKGSPDQMPRVRLNAGTLQYTKISNGQTKVGVSVPLNAQFESDERTEKGYSFEITTATMASGYGNSRLTGTWKPGNVTITGGISSIDVPELEMAWIIDVLAAELKYDQSNAFSLKLNVRDLQSKRSPALEKLTLVGPAFLEQSGPFAALQRFFNRYEPRGQVDIELEASGHLNRLGESTFSADVYCKDVAICHHKFAYPIDRLAGRIKVTENSVTLCNLVGRHGEAELTFNGWCRDYGPDQKYQIQIRSDNMPLDDDLYNALTAKQQAFWCAFAPSGRVAIDYTFARESPTNKRQRLDVELRGTNAVYQHFPYPLENLSGKLSIEKNNVVFSNVVSNVDERHIMVNGRIAAQNVEKKTYDISVNVEDFPLNSTLEEALPEKQRNLYARCHPEGLADGWVRITKQGNEPASYLADLSFEQASLRSDAFPLPITGISAKAAFTPDWITIKAFSGRYNDGSLSLSGRIRPAQQKGQSLYDLAVKMEQMPLDDDLLSLLPETLEENVSDLNPSGPINLSAQFSKDNPTHCPAYDIHLECLGNQLVHPNFSYPLEEMTGFLTLDANHMEFRDVKAVLSSNGSPMGSRATINLNGEIALADGALNSGLLALSAQNVPFDEQFRLLLPAHMRPSYDRLSPTGFIDLNLDTVRLARTSDGQKAMDFAGSVTLKNCAFNTSNSRMRLGATLNTGGLYRTGKGFISCQTALRDGLLMIRGKSFTNLKADISYDPESRRWSTDNLIAHCYDGKVTGRFQYLEPVEQPGQYVLQAGFTDVNLKRFLADAELERAATNGHTSGKMNGSLCINATTGDQASRIGSCKLSISDMQVGKLSPLAKLLQVLRFTEPQDYAFDRMIVDAYIRRDGLFVRNLDLSGQDVAFSGSGRMDLRESTVDLILTARGRRLATDDPSVLQSLTEGLGQAVVRLSVTGGFHDPKVKTETLPVIEGTLQVLGARPATRN